MDGGSKHIKITEWFAWRPVKTECGKWVWLKTIKRVVDERPEYYLGLLPENFYYLLEQSTNDNQC